jgi:SsrA-binding protein
MKTLSTNKKAFFDYTIQETLEAGVKLTGDEVKALRAGLVNLTGSFAVIKDNELFLLNCYIGPYSHAYTKVDEKLTRKSRKLLVHRRELSQLAGAISRKGLTVVPLKIYLSERGYVKIELGIARHKNAPDRKQELRDRDLKRESRREAKYAA